MLTRSQTEALNWHPLKDRGRVDNYALSSFGHADAPRRDRWARYQRPGTPRGPLFYLMACGHRSLPSKAVCERGCLTAPMYRNPAFDRREERRAAKIARRIA